MNVTIKKLRKRFWWPHPYAEPYLFRNIIVGFEYCHDGKLVDDPYNRKLKQHGAK